MKSLGRWKTLLSVFALLWCLSGSGVYGASSRGLPYPDVEFNGWTLPIVVFFLDDFDSISELEAMRVVYRGISMMPEMGRVRWRVVKFVKLGTDLAPHYSIEGRENWTLVLRDRLRTLGYTRNDVLHLAIVPPLREGGVKYMGGVASGVCEFGEKGRIPTAYVNAMDFNSEGEARLHFLPKIVAHELGHLVGAEHYEQDGAGVDVSPTVMHPAVCGAAKASGANPLALEFSAYSAFRISVCLSQRLALVARRIRRCERNPRFKTRRRTRRCIWRARNG